MIGSILLVGPFVLLLALAVCRWSVRRFGKRPFLWPPQSALNILTIAVVTAGLTVLLAASLYSGLIARFPGVVISPHEPEYFAVQTLTTVGYGSALAPVAPNAPPGLESGFQALAKWLMFPQALVCGFVIGAIVNLFFSIEWERVTP